MSAGGDWTGQWRRNWRGGALSNQQAVPSRRDADRPGNGAVVGRLAESEQPTATFSSPAMYASPSGPGQTLAPHPAFPEFFWPANNTSTNCSSPSSAIPQLTASPTAPDTASTSALHLHESHSSEQLASWLDRQHLGSPPLLQPPPRASASLSPVPQQSASTRQSAPPSAPAPSSMLFSPEMKEQEQLGMFALEDGAPASETVPTDSRSRPRRAAAVLATQKAAELARIEADKRSKARALAREEAGLPPEEPASPVPWPPPPSPPPPPQPQHQHKHRISPDESRTHPFAKSPSAPSLLPPGRTMTSTTSSQPQPTPTHSTSPVQPPPPQIPVHLDSGPRGAPLLQPNQSSVANDDTIPEHLKPMFDDEGAEEPQVGHASGAVARGQTRLLATNVPVLQEERSTGIRAVRVNGRRIEPSRTPVERTHPAGSYNSRVEPPSEPVSEFKAPPYLERHVQAAFAVQSVLQCFAHAVQLLATVPTAEEMREADAICQAIQPRLPHDMAELRRKREMWRVRSMSSLLSKRVQELVPIQTVHQQYEETPPEVNPDDTDPHPDASLALWLPTAERDQMIPPPEDPKLSEIVPNDFPTQWSAPLNPFEAPHDPPWSREYKPCLRTLPLTLLDLASDLVAIHSAFKRDRSALLAWIDRAAHTLDQSAQDDASHVATKVERCALNVSLLAKERVNLVRRLYNQLGVWVDALDAQLILAHTAFQQRHWDTSVFVQPSANVSTGPDESSLPTDAKRSLDAVRALCSSAKRCLVSMGGSWDVKLASLCPNVLERARLELRMVDALAQIAQLSHPLDSEAADHCTANMDGQVDEDLLFAELELIAQPFAFKAPPTPAAEPLPNGISAYYEALAQQQGLVASTEPGRDLIVESRQSTHPSGALPSGTRSVGSLTFAGRLGYETRSCPVCARQITVQNYTRHVAAHEHGKRRQYCAHCSWVGLTIPALTSHHQRAHPHLPLPNACAHESVAPPSALPASPVHSRKTRHCDECDSDISVYGWRKHQAAHAHQSGSGAFPCSACKYRGDTHASLRRHQITHHITGAIGATPAHTTNNVHTDANAPTHPGHATEAREELSSKPTAADWEGRAQSEPEEEEQAQLQSEEEEQDPDLLPNSGFERHTLIRAKLRDHKYRCGIHRCRFRCSPYNLDALHEHLCAEHPDLDLHAAETEWLQSIFAEIHRSDPLSISPHKSRSRPKSQSDAGLQLNLMSNERPNNNLNSQSGKDRFQCSRCSKIFDAIYKFGKHWRYTKHDHPGSHLSPNTFRIIRPRSTIERSVASSVSGSSPVPREQSAVLADAGFTAPLESPRYELQHGSTGPVSTLPPQAELLECALCEYSTVRTKGIAIHCRRVHKITRAENEALLHQRRGTHQLPTSQQNAQATTTPFVPRHPVSSENGHLQCALCKFTSYHIKGISIHCRMKHKISKAENDQLLRDRASQGTQSGATDRLAVPDEQESVVVLKAPEVNPVLVPRHDRQISHYGANDASNARPEGAQGSAAPLEPREEPAAGGSRVRSDPGLVALHDQDADAAMVEAALTQDAVDVAVATPYATPAPGPSPTPEAARDTQADEPPRCKSPHAEHRKNQEAAARPEGHSNPSARKPRKLRIRRPAPPHAARIESAEPAPAPVGSSVPPKPSHQADDAPNASTSNPRRRLPSRSARSTSFVESVHKDQPEAATPTRPQRYLRQASRASVPSSATVEPLAAVPPQSTSLQSREKSRPRKQKASVDEPCATHKKRRVATPVEPEESVEDSYCYCGGGNYGKMVGCDNDDCPRQWYHVQCVGLKRAEDVDPWYCNFCAPADWIEHRGRKVPPNSKFPPPVR